MGHGIYPLAPGPRGEAPYGTPDLTALSCSQETSPPIPPPGISFSLIHSAARVICNQMLTEFAVGVGGPGHGRKPSQLMVMIDR